MSVRHQDFYDLKQKKGRIREKFIQLIPRIFVLFCVFANSSGKMCKGVDATILLPKYLRNEIHALDLEA